MTRQAVTARIADTVSAALDALANDVERSRSWVIARAIERYVAQETALIAAIQKGESDLAGGRVFTQEQVEAMFAVKRDRRDAA